MTSGNDHAPDPVDPTIDPTVKAGGDSEGLGMPPAELDGIDAKPGDQIGSFKLLQKLGEGGFGVVFLAEQSEPVKRRVALKLIKAGMDTKAVIARFEAERQALAMMDHPGIARVYEAGATPEGRPYFAMEFVKGEPIDVYCDKHRLNTKARLELFKKVCDAVQHAHTKGIIHRDLKPGNILVTISGNEQPQPKVIDFGIAKATSQPLTSNTLHTQHGQLIGTPEYMSPEQAEMTVVDIDTRSDVYSLGVILYEMLTGVLPFDSKTLRSHSIIDIQQMIRQAEPDKPSTRVQKMDGDQAGHVEQAHRTRISELARVLKKELEWIPMKAIRKDRLDRYDSASALGDDIERYLDGQPLVAGPESTTYRMRKFVRRNRGLVGAIAAVLLALVVGIVTTTFFAIQSAANAREARAEEAQARAAEEEALQQTRKFQQMFVFVKDMFQNVDPKISGEMDKKLLETIINDAARQLDEDSFENETVRAELLGVIAIAHINLGDPGRAVSELRQVISILESGDQVDKATIQDWKNVLGFALSQSGDYKESIAVHQDNLEEMLQELDPDSSRVQTVRSNLATALMGDSKFEEAVELMELLLETRRRTLGETDEDTLSTMGNLATIYLDLKQFDRSRELAQSYHEQVKLLHGDTPHPDIPQSLQKLANLADKDGDPERAVTIAREAIDAWIRLYDEDHLQVALVKNELAGYLSNCGRRAESIEVAEEALPVLQKHNPAYAIQAKRSVAINLDRLGEDQRALNMLEEIYQDRGRVLGPTHINTINSIGDIGLFLLRRERFEDALARFREGEALLMEHQFGMTGRSFLLTARHNISSCLRGLGEPDQLEEAIEYSGLVLKDAPKVYKKSHWIIGVFKTNHGKNLLAADRHGEAEAQLEEAWTILEQARGPDHERTLTAAKVLVQLMEETGDREGLELWQQRAGIQTSP